jgi:diguanylate cyclase (GGDEF)-like protein
MSQTLPYAPAELPDNEASRVELLHEYGILDTLPEQSFDDIAFLAAYICHTPVAMISLVDTHRQWFKSKIGTETAQTPREHAFCAHAILTPSDVFVVNDAAQDARFAANPLVLGDPHIRFYAGAPLVAPSGEAMGALCVIDREPRQITPDETKALQALSREVIAQLELRRSLTALEGIVLQQEEYCAKLESYQKDLEHANTGLEVMSVTDALTGAYSRRAFDQRLTEEFSRATREHRELSILLVDVDHFKPYNDEFGHPAGDDALQTLVNVLRQNARVPDVVARYGGEEFVVLLPNSSTDGALVLAERFRRAVQRTAWPRRAVTVSIGASTSGPDITDPVRLVAEADRALYAAKERGRNRAVHARQLPPEE